MLKGRHRPPYCITPGSIVVLGVVDVLRQGARRDSPRICHTRPVVEDSTKLPAFLAVMPAMRGCLLLM